MERYNDRVFRDRLACLNPFTPNDWDQIEVPTLAAPNRGFPLKLDHAVAMVHRASGHGLVLLMQQPNYQTWPALARNTRWRLLFVSHIEHPNKGYVRDLYTLPAQHPDAPWMDLDRCLGILVSRAVGVYSHSIVTALVQAGVEGGEVTVCREGGIKTSNIKVFSHHRPLLSIVLPPMDPVLIDGYGLKSLLKTDLTGPYLRKWYVAPLWSCLLKHITVPASAHARIAYLHPSLEAT